MILTRALVTAAAIAVTGCAFVPTRHVRLEAAQAAFEEVESDSRVSLYAPAELQRARETLKDAITARNTLADPALVDHLAYLAKQRIAIAQERARPRALWNWPPPTSFEQLDSPVQIPVR